VREANQGEALLADTSTTEADEAPTIHCRVRGSAGFTLIELLIALSMFTFVLLAVMAAADFATKSARNETERNVAITEATTGAARMIADMRRAYKINFPELPTTKSNVMDLDVRVAGSGLKRIFYDCAYKESSTYNECVRYESSVVGGTAGTAPAGVTPQAVIRRVLNETSSDKEDPVFQTLATPSGSGKQPTSVEIVLHIAGKGELSTSSYKHQLQITNSFYLPNLDFGH